MIEDKDLGLKVAETPEEALWERVRKAREQTIKDLEESLIVEKEILKTAESKLRELKGGKKKDGNNRGKN